MRFLVTLTVVAVIIAGCTAPSPAPPFSTRTVGFAQLPPIFSGRTVAYGQLRSDTLRILVPFVQAKTGCDHVASIATSIVFVPGAPQAMPGTVTHEPEFIVERWVAIACGNQVPLLVRFTHDGQGGTYIAVQPESP